MNELLQKAIQAALQAGQEILKIYEQDFAVEHKADESPLTQADLASNRVIVDFLKNTQIPIISEEMQQEKYALRKDWARFWLVDPLDGTKEFVNRNGEFTVNIALIEKGKPVLGVIYAPCLKWLYFADETGSFKQEKITQYSEFSKDLAQKLHYQKPQNNVVVVASRSHLNEPTEKFIQKLNLKYQSVEKISMGSSLKLCLVAESKAHVYPRFAPTMEWDIAAGHAICRFAGVPVVQAETGEPIAYNKENLLNPYFLVGEV
ncbi:3'(2'),5'-bisphosphate nucleotidase [Ornithobacterium rhinotracheale]|uniref:3'(2'),5'-bisphosphate nucleotidase CysQ n=1 Tax=Ornithobacterium rhinotracheale TaxID=28251 RepID=UPI00129C80D2|nr:3'(2'),5'-bisphosphate nucleotidase CysQ [Ornithobacterium rhinotracheale]MRJ08001.1 3'(2'),5'-bisphosphate nucleotidase [Ornithobacterium rhinotracheale]UOH78491.1 3'(2'),5'-bisphosphate nucleotidase CysQ [Ornithobacterium rhinotracheale]